MQILADATLPLRGASLPRGIRALSAIPGMRALRAMPRVPAISLVDFLRCLPVGLMAGGIAYALVAALAFPVGVTGEAARAGLALVWALLGVLATFRLVPTLTRAFDWLADG